MSRGLPRKLKEYPKNRLPVYPFFAALICLILVSKFSTTATVAAVNQFEAVAAPVIDLNGIEKPGVNYATTFVEGGGAVTIVAPDLAIISDSSSLTSATIKLKDNPDNTLETIDITADLSSTAIKKDYDSQRGILRLSGSDTIENYETVLQTVSYINASEAPNTADREVTFTIRDGTNKSDAATSTVAILAVNDAPVLDNSGDMHLDPIDEDDLAQIGNYVATIIASAEPPDRISDPDDPQGTEPEGIAVIDVSDSNGTWEFSLDSGASWERFGTVGNSSAVLLDESARIRFLPDAHYNGIASLIIRAWDQTTEAASGKRADASVNGGSSAFSVATQSVSIEVLAVNDPPIVDLNGKLPGVEYVASFLSQNTPVRVAAPDAFVNDEESSEIVSLKVTLTNRPDGTQESLIVEEARAGIQVALYDPTTGELKLEGAASLADYSAVLRSISYLNEAETMNVDEDRVIEFIASDGTDDSQLTRTTLVSVLSNVAPVLDPTKTMHFTEILEDELDPSGDMISALLASAESDPIQDLDPNALRGFAVVGAENSGGAWQFSIDAGQSWLAVGNVSDSAALLLNEQAKLRFLPNPNFGGAVRNTIVRAWDQSEGSNGIGGVDVTNNGGVTPFSNAKAAVPVTVQSINDAPRVTITEGTIAQFIEGNEAVVIAGPTLQIDDIDNDYLQSATVTIKNLPANEPDILDATTNGLGIAASYDEAFGTLHLSGKGTLADYQALLRSVTFNNLSQDPAVVERLISFVINDGSDPSDEALSSVRVEAVNDVPQLDLNGEIWDGTHNTVYFDKDGSEEGGSVDLARTLEIQDPDNTTLIGAAVYLENRPDGSSERLGASTDGTNISATINEDGREIKFSGQDSLAAYQKVLRTVVYSNRLPFANRAIRKVSFSAQDASSGESRSISKVVVRPQYAHIPIIVHQAQEQQIVEEPNDSCQEAVSIAVNVDYEFGADDLHDWFSFAVAESATVAVELTEFAPEAGQLAVAEGSCGALDLLGHNGDFSSSKAVSLGTLQPGRYLILVINDGPKDLDEPYHLRVDVG